MNFRAAQPNAGMLTLNLQESDCMNRAELKKTIVRICNQLIEDKGFICAIDVLCKLDYLNQSQITDWRFGKIQYLEKVCGANLGKLTFINKTIREIANNKKLKPSWTAYNKYGKGVKTRLVFSKTKDEFIEKAYATHYIDADRIYELKRKKACSE